MKNIRYMMLFGIVSLFHNGFAGVVAPKFEKDFNDLISKSKLAVVHFVDYDLLPVDKEHAAEVHDLMEQLDDLKKDFSDISHDDDFAGIVFVGVDLKSLPHMVDEYDIKDVSTFMLFKDGRPFKQRREVVKRTGMMTQDELEDWIDDHFEDFKPSVRAQQPTQQVIRYAQPTYTTRYYSRPYYGGYRPYWRRGYYGRPYGYGSGFGFGIGGRRGGFGFGIGGW